jgi:hypothetical protein
VGSSWAQPPHQLGLQVWSSSTQLPCIVIPLALGPLVQFATSLAEFLKGNYIAWIKHSVELSRYISWPKGEFGHIWLKNLKV